MINLVSNPQRRAWYWVVAVGATLFLESSRGQMAGPAVEGFDKIAHFFVFGLLGTLLARVDRIARCQPPGIFTAVAVVSAFGASDEFHQSFTPGRSAEFNDWLADTLGALVAVAAYARWPFYRRWLEKGVGPRHRVEIGGAISSDRLT